MMFHHSPDNMLERNHCRTRAQFQGLFILDAWPIAIHELSKAGVDSLEEFRVVFSTWAGPTRTELNSQWSRVININFWKQFVGVTLYLKHPKTWPDEATAASFSASSRGDMLGADFALLALGSAAGAFGAFRADWEVLASFFFGRHFRPKSCQSMCLCFYMCRQNGWVTFTMKSK